MSLEQIYLVSQIVSAAAIVASLVFVGLQIRQSDKLALAQTYQMRSDALQAMLVHAADSQHIGPVIGKLTALGYPEDVGALNRLDEEERARFRLWQIAQQTHWDNMYFQFQHGFLDKESYEDSFKLRVRRLAPTWRALDLMGVRRSLLAEIKRLEQG
jgi:hypothetical protein